MLIEVPVECWRLSDSFENITKTSKLWILTNVERNIGRELSWYYRFGGGHVFQCDSCYKNTPMKLSIQAWVRIQDGKVLVECGAHLDVCKPIVIQELLPEIPRSDDGDNERH